MEERINSLKDRNVEMIQVEEKRKRRFQRKMKKLWELFHFIRKSRIKTVGVSEEEERLKGAENFFEERIPEDFSSL